MNACCWWGGKFWTPSMILNFWFSQLVNRSVGQSKKVESRNGTRLSNYEEQVI